MKKLSKRSAVILDGPALDRIKVHFSDTIDFESYPFSLSIIKNLKEIKFPTQVIF